MLICHTEIEIIGSTSFGFAQNTIDDFQNTLLNSSINATKTALWRFIVYFIVY